MDQLTHYRAPAPRPRKGSAGRRLRLAILTGCAAALTMVGSVLGSGFAPTLEPATSDSDTTTVPGTARAEVMAAVNELPAPPAADTAPVAAEPAAGPAHAAAADDLAPATAQLSMYGAIEAVQPQQLPATGGAATRTLGLVLLSTGLLLGSMAIRLYARQHLVAEQLD